MRVGQLVEGCLHNKIIGKPAAQAGKGGTRQYIMSSAAGWPSWEWCRGRVCFQLHRMQDAGHLRPRQPGTGALLTQMPHELVSQWLNVLVMLCLACICWFALSLRGTYCLAHISAQLHGANQVFTYAT
jgi:hypothetical protein